MTGLATALFIWARYIYSRGFPGLWRFPYPGLIDRASSISRLNLRLPVAGWQAGSNAMVDTVYVSRFQVFAKQCLVGCGTRVIAFPWQQSAVMRCDRRGGLAHGVEVKA